MSQASRSLAALCGALLLAGAAPEAVAQAPAGLPSAEVGKRQVAAIPVTWRALEGSGNAVKVRLLTFNDFHGRLETKAVLSDEDGRPGRPVGGAAVLAAWLDKLTARDPDRTVLVLGGDQIGGSPPISALLQDEPTFSFMNRLARGRCPPLKRGPIPAAPQVSRCQMVATVGNHEFDEGPAELERMLYGGKHAAGPYLERRYGATRVPFIAANVVWRDGQRPFLPGSTIVDLDGVRVGFVAVVTSETPSLVPAERLKDLQFLPEVAAANAEVAKLKAAGVRTIVAVMHEGLTQHVGPSQSALDTPDVTGRLLGLLHGLDPEVDVVVSGHTHKYTNALIRGSGPVPLLVTQAFMYGTGIGEIELLINRSSGDVVMKTSRILTPWADEGPGLEPVAAIAREVERAHQRVLPAISRVIGQSGGVTTRVINRAGESAMGNLVSDAQRAIAGTDFALMNTGGLRADLDAGPITWDDVFSIQPFGNLLVRVKLTGEQLQRLLEQQWDKDDPPGRIDNARVLKVSGLRYRWDGRLPWGNRISGLQRDDGTPIDPRQVYTVAANDFILKGGDFFTVFAEAPTPEVVGTDLDVLIQWLQAAKAPVSGRIEGRITRLDP